MRITETKFEKVKILEFETRQDCRGIMDVSFNFSDLQKEGIEFNCMEQRIYHMTKKGTFFGIHFQTDMCPQEKIISVISGRGIDYIVDLNEKSSTYKQWISLELCGKDNKSVYIPQGYGHAFLSLEHNTIQLFTINQHFCGEHSKQIRYNDPEIGLKFPINIEVISDYDKNAQLLNEVL